MRNSAYYFGGIGLIFVLAAFLVIPLWTRNANHPLSGRTAIDVCGLLEDAMLMKLPEPPVKRQSQFPGQVGTAPAVCFAELPAADGAPRFVQVAVTTQRMLSAEGRAAKTDRFVETWLAEAEVDGAELEPVAGPWRRAALVRERRGQRKLDLLADDAGVVLWISSRGLDRQSVLSLAEAAARRLRTEKG